MQTSCAVTAQLISVFIFALRISPILHKSEILSFRPSSETVQAGICRNWSETETIFSHRGSVRGPVTGLYGEKYRRKL